MKDDADRSVVVGTAPCVKQETVSDGVRAERVFDTFTGERAHVRHGDAANCARQRTTCGNAIDMQMTSVQIGHLLFPAVRFSACRAVIYLAVLGATPRVAT